MKALVTGCAGFIGSNLTDYLLDLGYSVFGIDCFTDYYNIEIKKSNLEYALKNKKFKLIKKNILDLNEFPEVNHIFHLAAQPGVRASWGENFHIYTTNNIMTTQKLLEFYKDINIKKFVYSSSSSVYGDIKLPMNEESILKPISPYGVTKLAAEHLTYLYWKNYNVPTLSLRYFTVYGPRQRPDMAINKFTKAILEGREINVFGDGNQTRDFTFVEDVVKANLIAAESEFSGETFNIGGGNQISIIELIENLGEITGKEAIINTLKKQKGDVKNTLADVGKVKKVLNWSPQVSIKEGLQKYIDWIKESEGIFNS